MQYPPATPRVQDKNNFRGGNICMWKQFSIYKYKMKVWLPCVTFQWLVRALVPTYC